MNKGPSTARSEHDAASFHRVAHELRSPLTSVLGLLSLLEDGSIRIGDDDARQLAAMGRREAEQMLMLVDDLVSSAKLARGTLRPETDSIDLHEVTRSILDRFPDVRSRTFIPVQGRAVVKADRQLVSQIITNLVQNIDRYAPDGAVEVRIEATDEAVVLHMADEGVGIAPENREQVFSDPASAFGLGLGLGLSRDLARLLGGDLEVSANPLRSGATLMLRLPQAGNAAGQADTTSRPTPVPVMLPSAARTLVEVSELLTNRNLDRLVAGIHKMLSEHLNAEAAYLMIRDRDGELNLGVGSGPKASVPFNASAATERVLSQGDVAFIPDLATDAPDWAVRLGTQSALILPVPGPTGVIGVLALGLASDHEPSPRSIEIATALSRIAGLGAERATLSADVEFERSLRASVIEALPLAVSIFMGDPPQVVDWNESERRLLGIEDDEERPKNIALSQEKFPVHYPDGTAIDLVNSPVSMAMATNTTIGPIYLEVTRADRTTVMTRNYAAPIRDRHGCAIGAVITAETIDRLPSDADPSPMVLPTE